MSRHIDLCGNTCLVLPLTSTQPLVSVGIKVQKYILVGVNGCVGVEHLYNPSVKGH
jgi:hypothetical protein